MKKHISIYLSALIVLALSSCSDNQPVAAGLLGVTECKSFDKSANLNTETDSDSVSCIEYEYDNVNKILRLKHINAGFNCCPGEITADIYFKSDTLIIEEFESESLCDCNCLYDLEFEVGNLPGKVFIIKMVESYIGDNEKIEKTIDLNISQSGKFCVTREYYPWGMF